MSAYKKPYLNNAADAFGAMTDYAVNSCGLDGDMFLHMFVTSGLAEQFEQDNPRVTAGMSGVELASKAIADATGEAPSALPSEAMDFRTPEFWAGWALYQYQRYCARSFATILRSFPFTSIVASYYPLHEADITKFYDVAEQRHIAANPHTNLKRLRVAAGLSQSRLAEEAGVTLRSIQMYEQRNKDINKAGAITVAKLARRLGCSIEDLLESEARVSVRAPLRF
jgi:DNA-binding XRE family transcriptional regulator